MQSSPDEADSAGALKVKRIGKLVAKKDGRFGLGYTATRQDLEFQKMQRERV